MANKTARVILKYEVDRAAQRQTERSIEDLRRELEQVPIELGELGTLARVGVGEVNRQFRTSQREIDSARRELELFRRTAEQTQRATAGAARGGASVARAGAGGITERIDRTGTVGSQIAGAFGASDLGNVVGLVGDLANSIQTLGSAGAVTRGVIDVISIALQGFNQELERSRATLNAGIAGVSEYFENLNQFSTIDALQRRSELRSATAALEQEREFLQDQLERAFSVAQGALGDFGARIAQAAGVLPTAQLQQRLDELNNQIIQNNTTIALYTAGIEENRFVVGDLIEETERQARITEAQAQAERDLISAKQEAIRTLEQERAATARANLENKTRTQQRLDSLAGEATTAREAVNTAREAEAQLTLQFEQRLAEQRQQIRNQEIDAEVQKQDRLADIRRRGLLEEQEAASNRDALAFVRAKRATAEQLRQTETDNQRRLRDLRTNANRQLQIENQRYRQELNIRQQATRAAINDAINAANALRTVQNEVAIGQIKLAEQAGTLVGTAFYNGALTSIFQLTGGGGLKPGGTSPGQFAGGIVKPFGGTAGLTINVTGATTKQVTATSKQQAINVFAGALARLPLK